MRGGKREGAGRKSKGNQLNPRAINEIRQKIKVDWIFRKLHDHIGSEATDADGKPIGTMNSSQVNAALGLLRKILPDLATQDGTLEHTGAITVRWEE